MRLKGFNYSHDAYYFVTLCTEDKVNYFGEIVYEEMVLNNCGKIASEYWKQIEEHFKNIILDEFVVMPNHLHGIIAIITDLKRQDTDFVGDAYMRPLMKNTGKTKMLLCKVIQQYKSSVTRKINNLHNVGFGWQRSFYDRIIRTNREFYNVQSYIHDNPLRWALDIENTDCFLHSAKDYYNKIFQK